MIGRNELIIELPEGTTGAQLMKYLAEQYPQASDLLAKSVLAKGEDYLPLDCPLKHQDQVVIIPPVSGGLQ